MKRIDLFRARTVEGLITRIGVWGVLGALAGAGISSYFSGLDSWEDALPVVVSGVAGMSLGVAGVIYRNLD